MRVFSAPSPLQKVLREEELNGRSIGFVPTMGALHDGHLQLVTNCNNENDISVVSIFVNPLQFNNANDLDSYPRVLQEDLEKLEKSGVDIVFTPSSEDLYPRKPQVKIDFGSLSEAMEGKFRSGHFGGVGIIVSKLFHLVSPDRAYFGLKDLQQYLLVKKLVEDLSFQIEIVGVETVRESSGLAMSSRNRRLSSEGLSIAANIFKGLERFKNGVLEALDLDDLTADVLSFYATVDGLTIEYLEVVNAEHLSPVNSYQDLNELAVCVAGYVEGVRLIDNLYLRLK